MKVDLVENPLPKDFQVIHSSDTSFALSQELKMNKGDVMRLDRQRNVRWIGIKSGVLWLTGTPAFGDIILRSGERYEFPDRWPFVLESLEPTAVHFHSW